MSSPIFNGTSRFSQDFQKVIQRAVAIASLPIGQLNTEKQLLTDRATALDALETKYSAITTTIQNLSSSLGTGSLSASVSDPSVASASLTGAALPGTYSINVSNLGSFTSTLSGPGSPVITDPSVSGLTASPTLTLTVGGANFALTPANSSLNALANSINAANAGVQATVVNLGAPTAPDYRLAVQSTTLGNVAISLSDGTSSLLNTLATGTAAVYTVNGQPTGGIVSNSRTVTLSPGLTVDLKAVGSTQVTVARSSTGTSNALTAFVTAFNAAVDETDKHRGKSGGALSGDSILFSLSSGLRNVAGYNSGAAGVSSLADLGVTFDQTGKLVFDASALSNVSDARFQQINSFLGSPTTGGFLKTATDVLSSLGDSTKGLIQASITSVHNSIQNEDALIAANQLRVDTLQTNLEAKMAAADALVATLEQQVTYFNALFAATQAQNTANNK